eukprot:816705_1
MEVSCNCFLCPGLCKSCDGYDWEEHVDVEIVPWEDHAEPPLENEESQINDPWWYKILASAGCMFWIGWLWLSSRRIGRSEVKYTVIMCVVVVLLWLNHGISQPEPNEYATIQWNLEYCPFLDSRTILELQTLPGAWKYFESPDRRNSTCVMFDTTNPLSANEQVPVRMFFTEGALRGFFCAHGLNTFLSKDLLTILWSPKTIDINDTRYIRSWMGAFAFPNLPMAHQYFKCALTTGQSNFAGESRSFFISKLSEATLIGHVSARRYRGFFSKNTMRNYIETKLNDGNLPWECGPSFSGMARNCETFALFTGDGWKVDDGVHRLTAKYIPANKLRGVSHIPRSKIANVIFALAVDTQWQSRVSRWYKDGLLKDDHVNLGKYISSGSGGDVWHADLPGVGAVAFKDTFSELELLREADSLIKVAGCPNVVALKGLVFGGKTRNGIVMEFISGGTLDERLIKLPNLAKTSAILASVADGMACIHKHGVSHNDLTVRNIMLDSRGHPVIIDFGFSLPHGARSPDSDVDFLRNKGEIDPESPFHKSERTDVYSFGGVIFQVFVPAMHVSQWYLELDSSILSHNVYPPGEPVPLSSVPPESLGTTDGQPRKHVRADFKKFGKLDKLMRKCYGPSEQRPTFVQLRGRLKRISRDSA